MILFPRFPFVTLAVPRMNEHVLSSHLFLLGLSVGGASCLVYRSSVSVSLCEHSVECIPVVGGFVFFPAF
jgi:hypothetical protein